MDIKTSASEPPGGLSLSMDGHRTSASDGGAEWRWSSCLPSGIQELFPIELWRVVDGYRDRLWGCVVIHPGDDIPRITGFLPRLRQLVSGVTVVATGAKLTETRMAEVGTLLTQNGFANDELILNERVWSGYATHMNEALATVRGRAHFAVELQVREYPALTLTGGVDTLILFLDQHRKSSRFIVANAREHFFRQNYHNPDFWKCHGSTHSFIESAVPVENTLGAVTVIPPTIMTVTSHRKTVPQLEDDIKFLSKEVEIKSDTSDRARFYLAQSYDGLYTQKSPGDSGSRHSTSARKWYRIMLDRMWVPANRVWVQEAYVACLRLMQIPKILDDSKPSYDDAEWVLLTLDSTVIDPRRYDAICVLMEGVLHAQYFQNIDGPNWNLSRRRLRVRALTLAHSALVLKEERDPSRIHFEFAPGREPHVATDCVLMANPACDQYLFFWNLSLLSAPLEAYGAAHTLLLNLLKCPTWSENKVDKRRFAKKCLALFKSAFPTHTTAPPHILTASQ